MQRQSKSCKAKRKAIIDQFYAGASVKSLSQEYNINESTIRYIFLKEPYALQTYGLPPSNRKCKITTEQKEEILQLYEKGEHLKGIAARYKISPSYVSHLLRKYKKERKERVMKNNNTTKLIKYSKPTKLCEEPYGTQWLHLSDENSEDIFIQVSKEKSQPDWKPIGCFLEKAFLHRLDDESFIENCLKDYESNTKESSM